MCTPLLPKMHTPRPFVKKCYGRKRKRLRSDRFRNATKPYIVKKYRKALQIKDFAKRNWTPIKIRIVSKLVSSYGPSDRVRTCGLMVPNHPRYQLRHTRIYYLLYHSLKNSSSPKKACRRFPWQHAFCDFFYPYCF